MQDINTEKGFNRVYYIQYIRTHLHFVLGDIYKREDIISNNKAKQRKTSALT